MKAILLSKADVKQLKRLNQIPFKTRLNQLRSNLEVSL